jgi:uncharacterized protein YecT (DUF1311 family)
MRIARLAVMCLAMGLFWPGGAFQPALAEENPASPCTGSPTEAAMLACHENELAKAQAELEDLVKELRTNFAYDGKEHTDALDFAQEKWKAFAGAECDLLTYDSRGGTAYDLYVVECLAKLHVRRAAEIKELLDSP